MEKKIELIERYIGKVKTYKDFDGKESNFQPMEDGFTVTVNEAEISTKKLHQAMLALNSQDIICYPCKNAETVIRVLY